MFRLEPGDLHWRTLAPFISYDHPSSNWWFGGGVAVSGRDVVIGITLIWNVLEESSETEPSRFYSTIFLVKMCQDVFLKVCTLMAGEIGPAETAAFNLVPRLQHLSQCVRTPAPQTNPKSEFP